MFYGKYWKVVCSFGIAFSFLFDIHLIYESIVGHSIIWSKNKHFQHIWQKSLLFSSNFVFENISFRYIFILTFQSSVEPSQVESWEEFSNWGRTPKFAVFLDKILIYNIFHTFPWLFELFQTGGIPCNPILNETSLSQLKCLRFGQKM